MNLTARRCERCDGRGFLRVRRVLDRAYHETPMSSTRPQDVQLGWAPRAVAFAAPKGRWQARRSLGRFEVMICRDCAYAVWYAFDLYHIESERLPADCPECAETTEQLCLPSLDRISWSLLEPSPLAQGQRSGGGSLWLFICEPCGRVQWQGGDYRAFTRATPSTLRLVDDDRACLRCDAAEAFIDAPASKARRQPEIAPRRPFLSMIDFDGTRAHLALRMCRPCGAAEWYARGLDGLDADDASVIEVIEPLRVGANRGPYR